MYTAKRSVVTPKAPSAILGLVNALNAREAARLTVKPTATPTPPAELADICFVV
jgi:hypothetical protein